MKTAYHFFLANAGYSYDPMSETPRQGRIRCAKQLAESERQASNLGYSFEWSQDDCDSREFSDDEPYYPLWQCIMHTPEGSVSASLGGIDFGRDGSPWGDSYRRVVEAELACEIEGE